MLKNVFISLLEMSKVCDLVGQPSYIWLMYIAVYIYLFEVCLYNLDMYLKLLPAFEALDLPRV